MKSQRYSDTPQKFQNQVSKDVKNDAIEAWEVVFFFFSNGMLRSVPFNYDLLQVKIGDVVMCFLVFQLF